MNWFGLQELPKDNIVSKKDFDLLLKIEKIDRSEDLEEVKLTLVDSDKMQFTLFFKDKNFSQG